jgi:hypothetical protein
MAYKINNSGVDDFIVNDDGVTETNGQAYKTRFDATAFTVNYNLTPNEHVIFAESQLGRGTNGDLRYYLPDSATDGVYDGQEIIIRVLAVALAVRVICNTDGIRPIGSSSIVTGLINLSANQSYHYVYSSTLGYWLQTK